MKTVSKILFSVFLILSVVSCDDATNNIDYVKPVSISFEGVGSTNIVQLANGVNTFDLKVNVISTKGIYSFSVYEANPTTGAAIKLIRPKTTFTPAVSTFSFDSIIGGLSANRAIQVIIEDEDLITYSKNIVLKITPAVIVSDLKIIETAEVYYGPYYASWLNGRCYMRLTGAPYSDEIDFSLGNIRIGTDTIVVPAFVSPDKRESKGLLFLPNLRGCTFALTTMTKAAFDAIPLIDGTVINNLPSPTLTEIKAEALKVYQYENATERGLIYVSSLTAKTATLEQPDGTWIKATNNYHELKIQTKTVNK